MLLLLLVLLLLLRIEQYADAVDSTTMFRRRRRLESRHPGHANKLRTAMLGNPSEPAPAGGLLSDGRHGSAKAPATAALIHAVSHRRLLPTV